MRVTGGHDTRVSLAALIAVRPELPEERAFAAVIHCTTRENWSPSSVAEEDSYIYNDNSLDDEVNRMCLADARMFLPGLNLNLTDRASMAASVEVRVPYVDPQVAHAAFSLDGSAKIRRREGKSELKRVAEDWLPREIVHRPKQAFGARFEPGCTRDLQELINDVLVGGQLTSSGMIRREALLHLIHEENTGRQDRAKQIWQLLTVELWYRHIQSMGVAG